MLDVILIIVSALCMIAGLAGCVLPFLPGPPIAYLGLVFLHFTDKVHYTPTQLIILAVDCSRGAGVGLLYSDAWQ